MTIQDLIRNTNLDKLETKLLLRHVLGLSQTELIMNNHKVLSLSEINKFQGLVQKLQDGIPISYILGFKEFYSRDFKVTENTLIPRPETELLVEEVLKKATNNAKVLDLGTGTGCIAITCKLENPSLDITAADKFPETLAVAKENAKNLLADINFICSDWYENITGQFDIIVSNPPYIEVNDPYLQNLRFEPQHALTDFANGLRHYEVIIKGAQQYLKNGGYILLEHGYQQKESLAGIFKKYNFTAIQTIADYASLDRITMANFLL